LALQFLLQTKWFIVNAHGSFGSAYKSEYAQGLHFVKMTRIVGSYSEIKFSPLNNPTKCSFDLCMTDPDFAWLFNPVAMARASSCSDFF